MRQLGIRTRDFSDHLQELVFSHEKLPHAAMRLVAQALCAYLLRAEGLGYIENRVSESSCDAPVGWIRMAWEFLRTSTDPMAEIFRSRFILISGREPSDVMDVRGGLAQRQDRELLFAVFRCMIDPFTDPMMKSLLSMRFEDAISADAKRLNWALQIFCASFYRPIRKKILAGWRITHRTGSAVFSIHRENIGRDGDKIVINLREWWQGSWEGLVFNGGSRDQDGTSFELHSSSLALLEALALMERVSRSALARAPTMDRLKLALCRF